MNVQVTGLDLSTRKTLINRYKIDIPGTKYLPAVRLGRWDGKASFFQLSGATYINLLPEILEYLTAQGYDIELEDLRDYNIDFQFDAIAEDTFANKKWPEGHPVAGTPVMLRDYQVETVNRALANPQSMQEIATGAGKTLMTAALSLCVEKYGRSIIIVPNKSLVEQTEEDYINLGLDVGVYFGGRKDIGKTHTICTWQSLNILLKNTKAGMVDFTINDFIEGVVCVIVDECHAAKAAALKDMLGGVMAKIPIRWGLTGTVPKDKYEAMIIHTNLGNVVGKLSASELQDQGVLSQCHVNIKQLVDNTEYNSYQSELKYLLENPDRMHHLAGMIGHIAETGNTLVLVDRIGCGKLLQTSLSSVTSLLTNKPEVAFISGVVKTSDRKDEYDEIKTSTNKIIIATYGVAAVGLNIPRIFNLVLVEPGKSFVRVIQSIGRGIRKAEDKDFVQIYDITSSCKFSKRHLTTRKKFYGDARYPFAVEKVIWQK